MFFTRKVATILTKPVTSLHLFRLIQASVVNTIHIINQSRKCTSFKETQWMGNQLFRYVKSASICILGITYFISGGLKMLTHPSPHLCVVFIYYWTGHWTIINGIEMKYHRYYVPDVDVFRLIQASVINIIHIINQSRKCTSFKETQWMGNQLFRYVKSASICILGIIPSQDVKRRWPIPSLVCV
jgi:hypothetical protein